MAATATGKTKTGVSFVKPGNIPTTARTMRTSGPNQFDTETFPNNGSAIIAGNINVQKNIPLLQPLAHVTFRLKLRLTVSVSITDCPPEAPQNLFSLIKLFGTHTTLGSETPFQVSGEIAGLLPGLLDRAKGAMTPLKINGTYYTYDQIKSGIITPTFFSSGSSPYDIEFFWIIPTYLFGSSDFNALQYLYDARSWGQTLQMQFQTRDAGAAGAFGTTGTKAVSAYGSGSGFPTLDILLDYANLGPALDASIAKAVVVRNSQSITNYLATTAGAGTRLLLMQNKKTTNVLIKTGTLETGSNNVYATLSDAILEQTQLAKNTTPIRNLQFNDMTDFFYCFRGARRHAPGYLLISATDGEPANNPHANIRADLWSASTQFNLQSQVISGSASNIGEAMQEYIDGDAAIAQTTSTASQTQAATT
jgi:hypothetical protein